jgi:catalase
MTEADAAVIQGQELGHATMDLYAAIEAGDFPRWDLLVQVMPDGEHPELEFDPLDDTKTWPEKQFPPRRVGTMTLNRNVSDFFTENEQIAFGTGVLVDGLDFSDDKMLVGRTFSYSDTQRYRVGPNYQQLPVNQPHAGTARTNLRDGAMAYAVDDGGDNPHINYEPSLRAGLAQAPARGPVEQGPAVNARLTQARLPRTDDYTQAGQRYLLMQQWERDDLVANLVTMLSDCDRAIQERMVWHFLLVEDELGIRVGDGLGIGPDDVRGLDPLPDQTLSEADQTRLTNLGKNGPRDVTGLVMTHCVPDERNVPAT